MVGGGVGGALDGGYTEAGNLKLLNKHRAKNGGRNVWF
jgi:hypothetical protein